MRVESRCYSSSAINNENDNCLNCYSGIEDRTTVVSNLTDQNTALSGTVKKEKSTGGFFSFLHKLRVANKNNLIRVDSTFSLPSPYSSAYSVTTDRGRWESVESVISSATAHSFAFIPSHQLRQFSDKSNSQRSQIAPPKNNAVVGVVGDKPGLRALYQHNSASRKNRASYYGKSSIVDAKKLHRNSTGNIENPFIAGINAPDRGDIVSSANVESLFDRKDSAQKEKRKRCHKPGKGRAPEPPYLCDNIDNTNVPKKVAYRRRKKRQAPSPPNIMAEEESRPRRRDQGENTTAIYNDSLKLEKGVLKAMKCREGNATNKSDGTAENRVSNYPTPIPVSPKPWYKRSTVNASMKKTCRSNEKRDSCRDGIDEWMLESGLPRVQRSSDRSKRTSQISVLANISELDREAGEIIEKERRKKRETEEKFYSEVLYHTGNEEFNSKTYGGPMMAKKNKDLISILNNITNVTTKKAVNTPIFTKSVKVNDSPLERLRSSSSFRRAERLKNDRTVEKRLENNVRQETQLNVRKQENRDMCREKVETVEENFETMITEVEANEFSEKIKNKLGYLHSSPGDVPYVAPIRPVKPFSSWTCPQCTLENPSWKFICELCHKWRPYSVNRIQNTLITPKEDVTLKTDDDGGRGRNTTTTDGIVGLNVNSATNEQQTIQVPLPNNAGNPYPGKPTPVFAETSSNFLIGNDLILQDLEKIRKARLQFFTKDISNKWSRPNLRTFETENRHYHERNKEDLCNILKEPKNTLSPSVRNSRPIAIAKVNCEEYAPKSNSSGNNIDGDINTNPNESRMRQLYDKNIEKLKLNFFNTNDDGNGNAPAKYGTDETKIDPKPATKQEDVLRGEGERSFSWQRNRSPSPLNFNTHEANDETRENKKITALAVNRLLKKLQTAIGNGQHHEAANIARELARLKVNCHVTRHNPTNKQNLPKLEKLSTFVISLYINERNDCRGPIPLQIDNTMALKKLKMKILDEFKIPLNSQRWIFEKIILDNENDILEDIGIDKPGAPLYLNLISANLKKESNLKIIRNDDSRPTTNANSTQNAKNTNDSAHIAKELEQFVCTDEYQDDKKEKLKNLKFQNNDSDVQITNDAAATDRTDSKIQISVSSTSKTAAEYIDEIDTRNESGWECTLCTLINEMNNRFCLVCGHEQNTTNRLEDTNTTDENKSLVALQGNYEQNSVNYQELIDLEKSVIITNKDDFECRVCLLEYKCGDGVVLRDCLHTFCKECLKQTIQHSTEAEVKCPFGDGNYSCESVLQQREIKALVDADIYEKHLARSVSEAENKIANAFHCKTANCPGWCIFEDNVNEFHCPVCERTNCLTCQVIHVGLNCKQYQEMTKKDLETSADASKTKSLLQEMVEKGDAMICPTCEIILMKKWGCDWLRCSMCKTEICWVTRGSRWGPTGKGDTTGGCRCGVNGIKCHPKCNYCH